MEHGIALAGSQFLNAASPLWSFTKWLTDQGVTDLLAAIGTVAATGFAVWQAGAVGRDRRDAARAAANVALSGIESALSVMESADFSAGYKGGQCRGILNTLMEIPLVQLTNTELADAVIKARAALHVIADRAEANRTARIQSPGLAVMSPSFGDQVQVLREAASTLSNHLRRSTKTSALTHSQQRGT